MPRRTTHAHASGGGHEHASHAGDLLAGIADHALDAVVTMDDRGRITGWNTRAEALFGWPAEEAIGRDLAGTIIPPRFRRAHGRGLARFMETGEGPLIDHASEVVALHRDGHELPVEISITALAGEGSPSFVGFVRDLSALQAAEAALRASESRFRSLVETLPGIAYVLDPEGTTTYVSPKVESMLGYRPEEWQATPGLWEELLHPDDRQRVVRTRAGAIDGVGQRTLVYRLRDRSGRDVWIRDESSIVVDEHGARSVHGVMFDISREHGGDTDAQLELAERSAIGDALRRLPTDRPAGAIANAICRELVRLPHLDTAAIYEFTHEGAVIPLGQVVPPGVPNRVGRPLPAERATYLRESATGPWIDEWTPAMGDSTYIRAWLDAGLKVGAYVPFGADGVTYGLLAAGTTAPIGAAGVARWLPSLTEFGAIAAALLSRELGHRREVAGSRANVARIVAERAFTTAFQPIVRISDGSVVGYEALTRFDDRTPPERQFGLADAIGMGTELEAATLEAALVASRQLPAGRWVSVNLSPSRFTDGRLLRTIAAFHERPVVVEITERLAIEDYAAIRAALERVAGAVEVAVDDAGAGFASLRHIIELRPRYVKLDMLLVRGVDADPARQALIAGMVFFARQSGCLLVAEGVETVGERDTLHRLGVPFGQGYLFGRPLAVVEPAATPLRLPAGRRARRAAG